MQDTLKKRILIIDDQAELIDILSQRLEMEGYEVEGQVNPIEGRRSANNNRPDLIILDLNIPEWSGFELIESLIHLPSLVGVPIIVLTARRDETDKDRVLKLGAMDFFTKPWDEKKLFARIKELII